MQGTSSNPISENLNTWPIYTYGCPSFLLLWFIQRKSNVFILVIGPTELRVLSTYLKLSTPGKKDVGIGILLEK